MVQLQHELVLRTVFRNLYIRDAGQILQLLNYVFRWIIQLQAVCWKFFVGMQPEQAYADEIDKVLA